MYALINANIYDYKKYIENGFIVFNEKIIFIGKMSEYQKNPAYKEIDCKNKLILPGNVSGHTHFYSTFARGASFDFNPQNFLDILKQMWWKLDHFLDKDMIYYSALMGGLDQMKKGTTSFIDHHASHQVEGSLNAIKSAINDKLNLRSILAFETSDRFDIRKSIEENMSFINNNHTNSSAGLFGMHASLSLSNESLDMISKNIGDEGIHIHVAESLMDEEECVKKYGMRVVERLDKYNLINSKSLLVHCTHIDETEMDIIKNRGATIAINPTSNLNNAVGISNVKKFLDKGIRVIVGNDGLMQSQTFEYLNTYYLSHLKTKSPIEFGLDDIKKIINNTYEYINLFLKTNLGNFFLGSEADLLVLQYDSYTQMTKDNIFGHVFFGVFPGFLPEKVFANGKIMIDDYKLTNDFTKEKAEALNQANKLWSIIEKEGSNLEFKN
ncbi:MAG: amidohydrolase family protein [Candidatus Izimaplasma sp.]|nr:amidohydrolase family protein [Candidatus Izimaplasma bacterium]